MPRTVDLIGNGRGFIYVTQKDGTTWKGTYRNDVNGVRDARHNGAGNAPLSASRSAFGIVNVLSVASVGQITGIIINGVNQIGGPINVTTAVNATEAAKIALAITLFTPGAGLNYTAQAIGDQVYIYEPGNAGGQSNGYPITVTVSSITIVTGTVDFANGAQPSGIWDLQVGLRMWLGPDAAITSQPNFAVDILDSLEITKQITVRGTETGMPVLPLTINRDALDTVNRYANTIKVTADTEGGAGADNLEYINPAEFIEGDIVYLKSANTARVVTVISAPNAVTAPSPNIYLTGDVPFDGSNNAILQLQFTYDAVNGAIFEEVGRSSSPSSLITVKRNKTVFVDLLYGDDATGAVDDFLLPFQTVDAAVAVMAAGYNMVVSPGTYAATVNICPAAGCTIVLTDATITGNNILGNIPAGSKIVGNGNLVTNAFAQTTSNVYIELNNLTIYAMNMLGTDNLNVNIKDTLTVEGYWTNANGACDTMFKWNKAIFSNTLNTPNLSCIQWTTRTLDSRVILEGDVYITGNYQGVFYSTSNNIYQEWNGRVFISPGISLANVYAMLDNRPASPQHRFRSKAQIFNPESRQIIYTGGNAEIEFSGDIWCPVTNVYVANANRGVAGPNLASNIYLKNVNIYAEGGLAEILHIEDTASRYILSGVKMVSATATSCINGAVAACKFQDCGGNTSTVAVGANAADEIAGPGITVSALLL